MKNNSLLRIALCMTVLGVGCARAWGAELFYMDHDVLTGKYWGPVGPLVLSGEIEAGDYDRLLDKILDDPDRFLAQNRIILASNGGDVGEAIKIARFVQSLLTRVAVGPQTGACVAACFLIYAVAAERATDAAHLIGLHRPQLTEPVSNDAATVDAATADAATVDAAALEARALAEVRAFLAANQVPADLLVDMFQRASSEVYWLSPEDEHRLGYKSPSFERFLAARCAWQDSVERDVYAGRLPFAALAQLLACRERVTQPVARRALAAAVEQRSAPH